MDCSAMAIARLCRSTPFGRSRRGTPPNCRWNRAKRKCEFSIDKLGTSNAFGGTSPTPAITSDTCRFSHTLLPVNSRIILPFIALATTTASVIVTPTFAIGTIGRGRLVGNAALRTDYDSNIFVNNSKSEDYVTTLSGELRYLHESGVISFESGVGAQVLSFADHTDQKAFDPVFDAKIGYVPSNKTDIKGTASFRQNSMANEAVNDRTKSDDLALDGTIMHLATEKLGIRVVGSYAQSAYHTKGYSDVLNYSAGVFAVEQYSPKLKLLAGVTTLEWWTTDLAPGQRSVSTKDYRYTVGAEGELAPKVTSNIQVGWLKRDFGSAGFTGTDATYVSAQVSWLASEKRTWSLMASENLTVTAAGQSLKSASASVNMSQTISEKLGFECSAGVDHSSYQSFSGLGSRTDNGSIFRARFNYALKDYVALDVSAGYRTNNSALAVSNYSRLNLGGGVTVRF